mgnify:CR=1 FL=1
MRMRRDYEAKTAQIGVAGHGTSSPYDIHNTLIAAGRTFASARASEVPTSNVDLAPTLLRLLGLPVPQTMTGRVIEEGLKSGSLPSSIAVTARNSHRQRGGRLLSTDRACFLIARGKLIPR